jgi:hypothetical protein
LKIKTAGILLACACVMPQIASAQTMQWTDKGYVSIDGGVQIGSHSLNTSSTFDLYGEQATVTSSQKVKGGGLFDIGGAYRVWGHNILGGIFYSHTSSDTTATGHADVPDPFIFGQPRPVDFSVGTVKHSENVVHLDAIWMMPVQKNMDVALFAGPSIFAVRQDTVGTLTATEPGPSVSAPTVSASKTTAGINLGADLQYMVYKKWAVGGTARYSWGSAKISGGKVTVGGFELAGGLRYRF